MGHGIAQGSAVARRACDDEAAGYAGGVYAHKARVTPREIERDVSVAEALGGFVKVSVESSHTSCILAPRVT
jgi:hypothetical protein